jgi:hypothetical protein
MLYFPPTTNKGETAGKFLMNIALMASGVTGAHQRGLHSETDIQYGHEFIARKVNCPREAEPVY